VAIPGEFDVQVELVAGASVAHVVGDLDLATADRLEEALADATAGRVVIDLTQCTFLDSAGVRAIAACVRDHASDGGVVLVADDPGILRILEITGIASTVSLHRSLDTAL
jgi:anti-anti-sigma factor